MEPPPKKGEKTFYEPTLFSYDNLDITSISGPQSLMKANMIYYCRIPHKENSSSSSSLFFVSLPPVFSTKKWLGSIIDLTHEVINGSISQSKLKWEHVPGLFSLLHVRCFSNESKTCSPFQYCRIHDEGAQAQRQ